MVPVCWSWHLPSAQPALGSPSRKPNQTDRNLLSPRILLSSTRLRTPNPGPGRPPSRAESAAQPGMKAGWGMAGRVAWDLAHRGDIYVGSDGTTTERPNPSGLGEQRARTWVGHRMPLPRAEVMAQPEWLQSRWRCVRHVNTCLGEKRGPGRRFMGLFPWVGSAGPGGARAGDPHLHPPSD